MIENEVRAHKLESTVVVVLRIHILKSLAFGCPQLKGGLELRLLHSVRACIAITYRTTSKRHKKQER